MSNFKPLLAATIEDTSKLDYSDGVLVSKKLDGIRCMIIDSVVYSRSMKPIRSKVVLPSDDGFVIVALGEE